MVETDTTDRRSYVRGDLFFKVKFRVMSPEEYETVRGAGAQTSFLDKEPSIDVNDSNKLETGITPNASYLDLLLHIDEKLDQILTLLSTDGADHEFLNQGRGVNLSGSGMKIIVSKPVEPGQIIHANFVLSRSPLLFLNALGEVVRVEPTDECGKRCYHLGIKFIDLNVNDRERIIARLFQEQRETIRKRKREKYESTRIADA